jgi:hypothetical protein
MSENEVCGLVSYDVRVKCPHCGNYLFLNQDPYDNEESEYSTAEDHLGMALFGVPDTPPQWEGLDLRYTCCRCDGEFVVSSLEI